MQQKRSLIIIPIIHTYADYGSLGNKVPDNQEYEYLANQYWQAISEYVENSTLDFPNLRVYQDGLPDIGTKRVEKIVDEIKTPNYNVLRLLRNKGAQIIGTESQPLLVDEYNALQAIFNAPNEKQKNAARMEYENLNPALLEERDKYIARRIKETLPEGGQGILFIGLAHEVKKFLEQEIEVSEPEALIGGSSETLRSKLPGNERK